MRTGLQHPREAEACGAAIAARACGLAPTVALSPALGGIVIGQEVAARWACATFAERQDGKLTLRRGFTLAPEDRVLVVEDVVTTGGSTRETIDVARAAGAQVVGAALDHRPQRRPAGARRAVSPARPGAVADLPARGAARRVVRKPARRW